MVVRLSHAPSFATATRLLILAVLFSAEPVAGQIASDQPDQLAASFADQDPYRSDTNDFGGAFANSISKETGAGRWKSSTARVASSGGQEESWTSNWLLMASVILAVGLASSGGAVWWRRHTRRQQKGPRVNLLGRAAR